MSNYSIAPGSVEKIYLKPVAKELLYKTRNADSHFDILCCHTVNYKERALGDLFVLGNVKFEGQEDTSYLISLVSSIARREFYSTQSLQEQNSKLAFERTLKKLNEVLENFFHTNNLALDVGLMAIANDNLFISRIGNVKVALSRNHEYIDVINNIELFDKTYNDNIQFSNIISGKIIPGDNLFAYIPFRSITSRERFIRASFIAQNQEEFTAKIASFSENTPTFNCCAIHIHLEQAKEVPISTTPNKDSSPEENSLNMVQLTSNPALSPIMRSEAPTQKHPNQRVSGKLAKKSLVYGGFIVGLLLLLATLSYSGYKVFELWAGPADFRALADSIQNTKQQAESEIRQGNIQHARELVYEAINRLSRFNLSKAQTLQADLLATISTADKSSNIQPSLFKDLGINHKKERFEHIALYNNNPITTTKESNIIVATKESFTELGKIAEADTRLLSDNTSIIGLSTTTISALDITSKTTKSLGTISEDIKDAYIFKNNLYILNRSNDIGKYEDIAHSLGAQKAWNKGALEDSIEHIAVDGNILGITNSGHIIILYKGKKSKDFDTQLITTTGTRLLTNENSSLLVVVQPEFNKIFIINKEDGSLQKSFSLPANTKISDGALSSDETLFLLTPEGKILSLPINS